MKIAVDRKDFLNRLNKAATVTENKATLPVLAAVLLEATGDGLLALSAYDLEVAYRGFVDATLGKTGKVAVAAKALGQVIATLAEGPVDLSLEKNRLVVRSGDVEFRLATLATEEFPALPEAVDGVTFPVKTSVLRQALGQPAYCISHDDTRYTLNGVFLETREGALVTTATDGHRLAHHEVEAPRATNGGGGIIVPRKAVNVLLKTLDGEVDAWDLTLSENSIVIESEEGERIHARLIEGQFPDYAGIVPEHEGPGATFDRKALLAMLGRMKLVSEAVSVVVENERLTLSVSDPERGEASEWCAVTSAVPKTKFKMNVNYLREALASWSGENVLLHLPSDGLTPLVLADAEAATSFSIIMPMRS